MLSPIHNFPLKFLYFDIIKKSKDVLFFLVDLSPDYKNGGVVQKLDTGCKCWVESGECML